MPKVAIDVSSAIARAEKALAKKCAKLAAMRDAANAFEIEVSGIIDAIDAIKTAADGVNK